LQSIPHPTQRYIGLSENVEERLADHNGGRSKHTSKYKPWKLVISVRFENDQRAVEFERYLKSGSGFSFANRHFW
jgi:predicted GIY-YIG superfamily endonuclease